MSTIKTDHVYAALMATQGVYIRDAMKLARLDRPTLAAEAFRTAALFGDIAKNAAARSFLVAALRHEMLAGTVLGDRK